VNTLKITFHSNEILILTVCLFCVFSPCSCNLLFRLISHEDQEEYDANEAEAEDTVGELPSSSESIIDSNPSLAISSFSDYIIANDPASKSYNTDERPHETQPNVDRLVNSGYSNGN